MSSSGLLGAFASAAVFSFVVACSTSEAGGVYYRADAADDVTDTKDAAAPDVLHDSSILSCTPADVTTFAPQPYVHAKDAHQGACTDAQIHAFYDDCLAPTATQQTCAPFSGSSASTENKACAACIVSRDSDPKLGPLVEHKGTISVNVAGCMEIADPANGLACAKAYQAADACERAACSANCPVTDEASFQLYLACVSDAAKTGCASFTSALACVSAEADAGASACFAGQTFADSYLAVAPIFCGSAPDGGAPDASRAD